MTVLTNDALNQLKMALREANLFEKMSDAQLEDLSHHVKQIDVKPQQVIFEEGDTSHCMYIIMSGAVQVVTSSDPGQTVILTHLKAGDFFGAQSLLPGSTGVRSATLIATEKGVLLEISADDFSAIINQNADLLAELQDLGKNFSRHKLVSQSALFNSLSLGQDSVNWLKDKTFQKGEVVFQAGDDIDQFYLILSGVAKAIRMVDGIETVHRLGKGNFFGSQALLNKQSCSTTVIAEETLYIAGMQGDKFLALYENNPNFREQMEHLQGFYHLPGEGIVTLHADKLMGKESLTAVYHYPDGVNVTSTKVLGKPVFSMSRGGEDEGKAEYYEQGNIYREIIVAKGRLLGVTVIGLWPDLGRVHQHISQGQRLFPWQLALFRQQGELWLNREREDFSDQAIVCRCMGIRRKTLNQALLSGCDTVAKLAEETGASKVCGACVPSLERLLGRLDHLAPVKIINITQEAENIKSFQFKPLNVPVQTALPGQHVRIEAQIDGRWIQRTYTLTSPANQSDYYEITVKRETRGIFSNWLHTQANLNSLLRVSSPSGQFHFEPDKAMVYFAGGIGITPAVAMYRSLPDHVKYPIYIDYSVVHKQQVTYLKEWEQADDNKIHVNVRVTDDKHFIMRKDVCALANQYHDAEFYVCGPKAYEKTVCDYLKQCNVTPEHINIEHFSSFDDASVVSSNFQHARSVLGISSFILFLIALFIWAPIEYIPSVQNSTWKQVTGFSLLALNIFAIFLGLRKSSVLALGYFKSWRFAHVLNGVLLIVLVFLHTGMNWGGHFNYWFLTAYIGILTTGAFAGGMLFLQQHFVHTAVKNMHNIIKWAHIALLLPFPALLITHIIMAYFF